MAEPGKYSSSGKSIRIGRDGKSINDIRAQFDRIRAYEGYGSNDPLYLGNRRLNRIYNMIVNPYIQNINDTEPEVRNLRIQLKQEALGPNQSNDRVAKLNRRIAAIDERLRNKKFPRSTYAKRVTRRTEI